MPRDRQHTEPDHAAPAVERTLRLLRLLGEHPAGLPAQALVESAGMPRATLYRMLRVLCAEDFVLAPQDQQSTYRLGPEIARLARDSRRAADLLAGAPPVMRQLARDVSETVKLVVVEGTEAVTLAVADPVLEARVTARVGTRVPLHIGASQRLLLAHSPATLWRRVLEAPLERRTARTVCDPAALRAQLERLRRVESEQSHGEGIEGVGAAAALVRGSGDRVLAALVAVYIHPGKPARQLQAIRAQVEAAALEISALELLPPQRA